MRQGLQTDYFGLRIHLPDFLEEGIVGSAEFFFGRFAVRVAEIVCAQGHDYGINGKIAAVPYRIVLADGSVKEGPAVAVNGAGLVAGPGVGVVMHNTAAGFGDYAPIRIQQATEQRSIRHIAVLGHKIIRAVIGH